jgi:hypothetical protein
MPRVRAVRGPVVLWRLLECSRVLVPLDAVGQEAFQTLRAALRVEPGKGIVARLALMPSITGC